jgi:hypothetical protein
LLPVFAIATAAGRKSGSAYSTVIIIGRSTIEIEGETAVFDDIGSSGLHVARRYCPRCGSPLTTEPDVTPDLMFVKAGGIDANEWFHPVMELFVGRRRPWVTRCRAHSSSKAIRQFEGPHHESLPGFVRPTETPLRNRRDAEPWMAD